MQGETETVSYLKLGGRGEEPVVVREAGEEDRPSLVPQLPAVPGQQSVLDTSGLRRLRQHLARLQAGQQSG